MKTNVLNEYRDETHKCRCECSFFALTAIYVEGSEYCFRFRRIARSGLHSTGRNPFFKRLYVVKSSLSSM